jgi:hypothetical protein
VFNVSNIGALIRRYGEIKGEWWIDDTGFALFADGDVGDYNHESLVLERLLSIVLNYLDLEIDERKSLDISEYHDEIYERFDEANRADYEISAEETVKRVLKQNGMEGVDEAFKVLHNVVDARDFALKYWGWKRVRGNNIQTQYLTVEDLGLITQGLGEIAADAADDETFDIEVSAGHELYEDVPILVLESGDVQGILQYKRRV